MSKKISSDEFHDAVERQLSGLKPDPWLAQRILAAAKGEKPMKKKATVSFALVLAIVLGVTAVASAATEVFNFITINLKGEVVATQPTPLSTPPVAAEEQSADNDPQLRIDAYLTSIAEEDYGEAHYQTEDGSSGGYIERRRTIGSEVELLECLSDMEYLTIPVHVPEGYVFDTALLWLGCDEAGEYHLAEHIEGNGYEFSRYTVDEEHSVVIGFDITYRKEDQPTDIIHIQSILSEMADSNISIPENTQYQSVDVPNMDGAVYIGGIQSRGLFMGRTLANPVVCTRIPDSTGMMPATVSYLTERIQVIAPSLSPDVLIAMYQK